jgi:predicted metal-dependent hydrolase
MLFTTFGFTISTALFQAALMEQDPEARGLGVKLRGLGKMWVSPGWFRRLVPSYLDYYRPDFHPWDRAAPEGIEEFKGELAGSVVRA